MESPDQKADVGTGLLSFDRASEGEKIELQDDIPDIRDPDAKKVGCSN